MHDCNDTHGQGREGVETGKEGVFSFSLSIITTRHDVVKTKDERTDSLVE